MKKLLLCLVAVATVFAVSCGGANTPADTAMKATGYAQDADFKSYFELVYTDPNDAEAKKELEGMATMLESKGKEMLEEKDGITNYEVVEEKIDADGKTANVVIKVTYGNGETENQPNKLKLDENGDWKLVLK